MKTKLQLNNVQHEQTVEIPLPLEVHPSVSAKAAALLEGVMEALMKTPAMYRQSNADHRCGSPCCIIGHMRAQLGVYGHYCDPGILDSLGLKEEQAKRLFSSHYWPTPHNSDPSPAQGIARIEHFLRTGE